MVKILHVEDNETQRELMQRLLEMELGDCQIKFANNGIEGLACAERWQPDVILMDLRMPGMDGFEAIAALKAKPATMHIPIIAISAWSNVQNEERALALGANQCIVKPFDLDEVMRAINACLSTRHTV
ncbi:MAG: response regulator [Anaerolineae bacterium]